MDRPADTAEVADRSQVTLHRGSADDVAALVAMHARCSAATRLRRYDAPMPRLSVPLAHALLVPDDGLSLVAASSDGDLVGIATHTRDRGDHVTLLVEDAWQLRGVGTRLLREVARSAARRGVRRLTATVRPDNDAVLRTVRRAGLTPSVVIADGLVQVRVPVARLADERGGHTSLAGLAEVSRGLVPLLHARQELREVHPAANMIDHAVRGGA